MYFKHNDMNHYPKIPFTDLIKLILILQNDDMMLAEVGCSFDIVRWIIEIDSHYRYIKTGVSLTH